MIKLSFMCIFLLGVHLIFAQDYNITPDDEDFSEGSPLATFLDHLELRSGLSAIPPNYTVSSVNCPDFTLCTINPNGTLLWEVRHTLYSTHMKQNFEDGDAANQTSLDGCLEYKNQDNTIFNECMRTVRTDMDTFLTSEFDNNFRELLQADCSLASENCAFTSN